MVLSTFDNDQLCTHICIDLQTSQHLDNMKQNMYKGGRCRAVKRFVFNLTFQHLISNRSSILDSNQGTDASTSSSDFIAHLMKRSTHL